MRKKIILTFIFFALLTGCGNNKLKNADTIDYDSDFFTYQSCQDNDDSIKVTENTAILNNFCITPKDKKIKPDILEITDYNGKPYDFIKIGNTAEDLLFITYKKIKPFENNLNAFLNTEQSDSFIGYTLKAQDKDTKRKPNCPSLFTVINGDDSYNIYDSVFIDNFQTVITDFGLCDISIISFSETGDSYIILTPYTNNATENKHINDIQRALVIANQATYKEQHFVVDQP